MIKLNDLKVFIKHGEEGASEAVKFGVRMTKENLHTHGPAEHHDCNNDQIYSATWNCSAHGVDDRLDG